MTQIQDVPGSYYGNTTVRNAAGAHKAITKGLNSLGNVEFAKSFQANYEDVSNTIIKENGDTYVWEFKLDKALLGNYSSLNFHITLGCGNDFLNETYIPEAVPEPATILLFGLGLAGAGVIRRRRRA
ncbi:MAG: PEP-CTERM sorting domain-containing protein [Candidatus Zixiibacteriota bacterium]|nr:MAG: PEP-CTERM sorting domain-containing protein [candidate division Zixibacteria bacterium]